MTRQLDTPADPCPKLAGIGYPRHVIDGQPVYVGRDGRRRARCRYCSRTIELEP